MPQTLRYLYSIVICTHNPNKSNSNTKVEVQIPKSLPLSQLTEQLYQFSEDYRLSHITEQTLQMEENNENSNVKRLVPLKAKYLGYGVVKLFKEDEVIPTDSSSQKDQTIEMESDDTTVAIIAIPSYFSPTDLLGFIGEEMIKSISHIRMIKSDNPNRLMGLIKFKKGEAARRFQEKFNGIPFTSMESEHCHVIFVKSVIFKPLSSTHGQHEGVPYFIEDPFTLQVKKTSKTNSKQLKIIKELPTCPVCLERMDSDVTGLLTISCQHTFHCNCLSKWRDDTCPVCRYSNLAIDSVKSKIKQSCSSCGSSHNLWICLICGNVGCGRYDLKHAVKHYEQTNHCFAMDLGTQRVWDYAGDNYVHRLLQNETDGKIVESGSSEMSDKSEKSTGDSLEYRDLLISQLESQREYYESRLSELSDLLNQESQKNKEIVEKLEKNQTESSFNLDKNQEKSERKYNQTKELAQSFKNKWKEEKAISENLLSNMEKLQLDNQSLKMEKQELESQVNDLMFFLESQEKFKDASDDVKNGTVLIQQEPPQRLKKKKNGHRK